jgi:CubicO group peptidase (beta-lactamase class C family)
MDSAVLAQMLQSLHDKELEIDSVLVIRNGHLVLEAHPGAYPPDKMHPQYSITKSVISALVGIAIEQGYLSGVDQPVLDLLPERKPDEVSPEGPSKESITLEHLMTMTSGLDWEGGDAGMTASKDWVQFVLDRPMAEEPGTRFDYNSGNTHVLSAILQETTGMTAMEYARQLLFDPLGITKVGWTADRNGINIGGWGIQMLPRDMAKLGYLYLHDGVWEGQQLIPADWIEASTKKQVRVPDPLEPWDLYMGYGWWIHEYGPYAAHGMAGQFILVVPELDMVVVFTSRLPESQFVEPQLLLRDYIMPAAVSSDPLPPNPDAVARLESLIEELEH